MCLVDDRLNNIDAEGFEISSQIYGIVHGLNKHCKKTCPVAVEGLNSIEKLEKDLKEHKIIDVEQQLNEEYEKGTI